VIADPTVSRPRRAVALTPMETRRDVIIDAALAAEDLGYDAIIVPEGWGLDAGVVLADLAARTHRIRLVAGVLSIWSRTPATMAMLAATLDDISAGRFVLGLGTSTPALAERFHGEPFAGPAMRLERYVLAVRALLAGERAAHAEGRGIRLGQSPRPDIPIWVAGLGPRARAIARRHADGWFPAVMPLTAMRHVAGQVELDRPSHPVVVAGPFVDADHGGVIARQVVGWYITGMGTAYGDNVVAAGFADEVDALRSANPRPRFGAIVWPDRADPLLAELAATGGPDEVGPSLAGWDRVADVVTVGVAAPTREAIVAAIEAGAPASRAAAA
jgi:alkanesulfonate monooxygenase SsuD/methylene tetrahydromethanopterin reductase-like flavin-dependent oxidoreductase (luciferase family)